MIDPRRLGVLQAVAVHGSVADAAGALHLSPPGRAGRPGPGNRRGRLPRHRRHWGITGAARR